MKIITDSGANLDPAEARALGINVVPFSITFKGNTYQDGIDLTAGELYHLMETHADLFPTTSQPSAGVFEQVYRAAVTQDHAEILSIHISSGLSGTYQAASLAAQQLPDAEITLFDTRTLSIPMSWIVKSAALAVQQGLSVEAITERLQHLRENSEAFFTLTDLKYLRHGGRISHIRSLAAAILRIKPIIAVGSDGKYETRGQEMTFRKALGKMAELAGARFPGKKLFVEIMHGENPEAVERVRDLLGEFTEFVEGAVARIPAALGSHTGPSLVGVSVMPLDLAQEVGLVQG